MTRVMTVSTVVGLVGLLLAMITALVPSVPSAGLAIGFAMTTLGMFGAVVGAAASLGRVWQSAR